MSRRRKQYNTALTRDWSISDPNKAVREFSEKASGFIVFPVCCLNESDDYAVTEFCKLAAGPCISTGGQLFVRGKG